MLLGCEGGSLLRSSYEAEWLKLVDEQEDDEDAESSSMWDDGDGDEATEEEATEFPWFVLTELVAGYQV